MPSRTLRVPWDSRPDDAERRGRHPHGGPWERVPTSPVSFLQCLGSSVFLSAPSAPSAVKSPPQKHWSSSGKDPALVRRRRGFESHPVLCGFFDNSGSATCAHDVAAAYRLAMADVRVRLPL